MLLFI